jgi:hypothetical protein
LISLGLFGVCFGIAILSTVCLSKTLSDPWLVKRIEFDVPLDCFETITGSYKANFSDLTQVMTGAI